MSITKAGSAAQASKPSFQESWNNIQAKMGAKPEQARKRKNTLDKDDFMRIMISQMQHQDPTKPFEADKLAQEIAQIASVEQLGNVNKALKKLSEKNDPLERMTMTGLIGKTVTVDRSMFPHSEGRPSAISFDLAGDAKDVQIEIVSDKGEVVLQKSIGSASSGSNTFQWDGKKQSTLPAETGNYFVRVKAEAENGQSVQALTTKKASVVGVSFSGAEPVLLVGDGATQERVTMSHVTRIEQSPVTNNSQSLATPTAQASQTPSPSDESSNFFAFKKGEGSKPIEMNKADHSVQSAIKGYQDSQALRSPAQAVAIRDEEKGFPNGMGIYNQQPHTETKKGGDE